MFHFEVSHYFPWIVRQSSVLTCCDCHDGVTRQMDVQLNSSSVRPSLTPTLIADFSSMIREVCRIKSTIF